MKIFVGNLSSTTTEDSLLDFFASYQPVSCTILRNRKGRNSGHCAILEIKGGTKGEHHALQTLDDTLLDGNAVKILEVREGVRTAR